MLAGRAGRAGRAAELEVGLTRHRKAVDRLLSREGLDAFCSALSGGAVSHPSTRVLIGDAGKSGKLKNENTRRESE